MTGVVHVNHGGTWKSLNFGAAAIHVKHSGTWKEPTGAWVKTGGNWVKVYPSDLEAWTTSNRPTSASKQTTSNIPNLSSDPAYIYTNILVADADVRWSGRAATKEGQWVRSWGYGWSPVTSAGFEYGAVTRVEVTFEARRISVPVGADYYRIRTRPQRASTNGETSNLTASTTLYTFDQTVAAWGLTDEDAGQLHTSPAAANSMQLAAYYNNSSSGSTDEVEVEDLKCRIKYLYN